MDVVWIKGVISENTEDGNKKLGKFLRDKKDLITTLNNESKSSSLFQNAINSNNFEAVKMLSKYGVRLSKEDFGGHKILGNALFDKAPFYVIESLVEAGADVNIQTTHGNALHLLCKNLALGNYRNVFYMVTWCF